MQVDLHAGGNVKLVGGFDMSRRYWNSHHH